MGPSNSLLLWPEFWLDICSILLCEGNCNQVVLPTQLTLGSKFTICSRRTTGPRSLQISAVLVSIPSFLAGLILTDSVEDDIIPVIKAWPLSSLQYRNVMKRHVPREVYKDATDLLVARCETNRSFPSYECALLRKCPNCILTEIQRASSTHCCQWCCSLAQM